MAEFIRDLLQRWFYNRRTNAHEMSTYLTTFADEHIKDRTKTAHRCEIHPIHFNTFKVDNKWKETTVDLDKRSCSCRQWDLDELLCSYAMAVASIAMEETNLLGRPKKLRIPSVGEKRKLQSCSKCGKKDTIK
ncbi:hypothetical protein Dsin_008918 [Dipteronia sinensis]|uniref:Zinc finger PMZ-type domain-containing protein n=1 Tax=Dipteronia sinensis TaxID=43782 RepID=A0AAE0APM0_9ROSI|nr:hypothetical protein Dsin_008918 [Dipteronia sinensis]